MKNISYAKKLARINYLRKTVKRFLKSTFLWINIQMHDRV